MDGWTLWNQEATNKCAFYGVSPCLYTKYRSVALYEKAIASYLIGG